MSDQDPTVDESAAAPPSPAPDPVDPPVAPPAPSPPRRPVGRWLVLGLALGLGLGGAGTWVATRGLRRGAADGARVGKAALYQCPMHPSVTSDHPGECPICGMRLVEVDAPDDADPLPVAPAAHVIAFYRSPMNPKQTSPVPRKDEMGMDYVAVYQDELAETGAPAVAGRAPLTIDPVRQQRIGLRTAAVTLGPINTSWRTVGRVQVDPTRVRTTNVKVEGYVERMFVGFVGQPVRRGQSLYSIFSPALVAAQKEYLVAVQTRAALRQGGTLAADGEALVVAARHKLELLDVPSADIDLLEQRGTPSREITIVSPIAGVVTAKNIVQGSRLSLGDAPYEITDLSMVWVLADAYETDLARVRIGAPATLTLKTYPDHPFTGKIAFVDPFLDARTRTVKVHIHVPNPAGELKPEMFGEVTLAGVARQGLIVPADAVISSGTRDVVFVAEGAGRFTPRPVELGVKDGDQVEVVRGLAAGEQVVVRANFLVDSESQLRSALTNLGGDAP